MITKIYSAMHWLTNAVEVNGKKFTMISGRGDQFGGSYLGVRCDDGKESIRTSGLVYVTAAIDSNEAIEALNYFFPDEDFPSSPGKHAREIDGWKTSIPGRIRFANNAREIAKR